MLNIESSPALPDMQIILDEETCIDHRIAASLALKHHWIGETEKALVWERLAIFLRASEAYIFDDISCCAPA
jgi:hypothetical protein